MPGNKNSGRKKTVQSTNNLFTEDKVAVEEKKKPGRPKKIVSTCQATLVKSVAEDSSVQDLWTISDDVEKSDISLEILVG